MGEAEWDLSLYLSLYTLPKQALNVASSSPFFLGIFL